MPILQFRYLLRHEVIVKEAAVLRGGQSVCFYASGDQLDISGHVLFRNVFVNDPDGFFNAFPIAVAVHERTADVSDGVIDGVNALVQVFRTQLLFQIYGRNGIPFIAVHFGKINKAVIDNVL